MSAPAARTALRSAARASQPALLPSARPASALRAYSSSPSSPPSSPSDAPAASSSSSRPTPTPQPTNLPGSNLPNASKYSPLTVSVVTKLAKVFGYHSATSTAIRTTSDYYDRCAERGEIEAPFFYEECSLPPSFQTWFSLTTLHVWLLSVRLRSLPAPLGRTYIQELINHMFIDVELRMRGPYSVTQSRLIKGYMKDMLEQYHGACAAYDEGLVRGDAVLAAAIWRNVFGAGWGDVGGVKGKRAPKAGEAPKLGPNPLQVEHPDAVAAKVVKEGEKKKGASAAAPPPPPPVQAAEAAVSGDADSAAAASEALKIDPWQAKLLKKDQKASDVFKTDQPISDPKIATSEWAPLYPDDPDLEFAQSLERIVKFVRKEVQRLERLPDQAVLQGKPEKGRGSFVDFTKL
ncbi:hypothetical protein JCM8547_000484 [Rhodosporidiobolus lusitaniae]